MFLRSVNGTMVFDRAQPHEKQYHTDETQPDAH